MYVRVLEKSSKYWITLTKCYYTLLPTLRSIFSYLPTHVSVEFSKRFWTWKMLGTHYITTVSHNEPLSLVPLFFCEGVRVLPSTYMTCLRINGCNEPILRTENTENPLEV